MAWVYLVIAGLLEVVWAYTMKLSDGFTRIVPTALTAASIAVSPSSNRGRSLARGANPEIFAHRSRA